MTVNAPCNNSHGLFKVAFSAAKSNGPEANKQFCRGLLHRMWSPLSSTHRAYVDAGGLQYPKDLGIEIIPTLGPEVCKSYLLWAIWIIRGKSA